MWIETLDHFICKVIRHGFRTKNLTTLKEFKYLFSLPMFFVEKPYFTQGIGVGGGVGGLQTEN